MYIAFIVILVLAGLFFGLKFTQVTENNDPVIAVLFKGLTTVCCIVISAVAVFHTTDRHFAVLLMFGLFFGFLGDELLALRFVFTEKFSLCFLSGAMSFLVGHVFYVVALYSIAPKAWIAAIPLLIIAMLLEYQNSKSMTSSSASCTSRLPATALSSASWAFPPWVLRSLISASARCFSALQA